MRMRSDISNVSTGRFREISEKWKEEGNQMGEEDGGRDADGNHANSWGLG